MKIGIISTYPPLDCGIGTYSSYLIEELRRLKNRVYIICHRGGEGRDCYPTFDYNDPDLAHKAFEAAMKFSPDLVHIQHEFGLFGEQGGMNVIPLAYKFKLSHIPIVITLHTVSETPDYEEQIIRKALVEMAEAIIKILTDKNLAKEFSDHARRYVEKHLSWQIITSKHMEVYNKILKDQRLFEGIVTKKVDSRGPGLKR